MTIFSDYMKNDFNRIEGWISREAAAVFDALLSFQESSGIEGGVIEIGAFKGKTAALLARHAQPGGELLVVDSDTWPSFEEMKGHVSSINPKANFFNGPSSSLGSPVNMAQLFRTGRFIHIDGDHSYEETYNDLKNAASILNNMGIVVCDDFFNPQHVHLTQTVFNFLYNNPGTFVMFMAGYNKAYLCRPNAFATYKTYVCKYLIKDIAARGIESVELCQTTHYPADSLCIGLAGREGRSVGYRTPDWENKWRTEPKSQRTYKPPTEADLQ